MPRKYYSAKEVNATVNASDKLKAVEEMLRRMEREQGTSKSDEGKARKQTKRWKTERKEGVKKAQERYEKKAKEIIEKRLESEPKTSSPAYEKELKKAQATAKKRLLMAKVKRQVQRVSPHGTYVSKLAERATLGSFQRAYTSKAPTHQFTKNIRPKKGLVKLVGQGLFPKVQVERGRPDWIFNRPPITGALGATNIFMNKSQTPIVKDKKEKTNGNIFWR